MFEGHSVNNFYREGWRPAMLKVGTGSKCGSIPEERSRGGFVKIGFVTAAGKEIAFRAPGQPLPVVPPDTGYRAGEVNHAIPPPPRDYHAVFELLGHSNAAG